VVRSLAGTFGELGWKDRLGADLMPRLLADSHLS